jgi:hypothetical protein
MSDNELLSLGKDAQYICSPYANLGQPPRTCFVIQLNEARAEWRRREELELLYQAVVRTTHDPT